MRGPFTSRRRLGSTLMLGLLTPLALAASAFGAGSPNWGQVTQGKWTSNCLPVRDGLGKATPRSHIESLEFSSGRDGSLRLNRLSEIYSGDGCRKLERKVALEESCVAPDAKEGASRFELRCRGEGLKVFQAVGTTTRGLAERSSCGIKGWKTGDWTDLRGTECDPRKQPADASRLYKFNYNVSPRALSEEIQAGEKVVYAPLR